MKGGHLFPSDTELRAPPANGIYLTYQKQSVMKLKMKKLCTAFSSEKEGWGSSWLRKTGILFAFWQTWSHSLNATAKASKVIMEAARIHDHSSVKEYELSAKRQLNEWILSGVALTSVLSPFKQILVASTQREQQGK